MEMDASLRWLPPLSLSLEPVEATVQMRKSRGKSLTHARGNCDCEKLRALARVSDVRCSSSSEHGIFVQAGAEMSFKGDINPLLSQMQILQKQEKI